MNTEQFLERIAYVIASHGDEIPEVEGPFGPTADWKWIIERALDDSYWSEVR